MSPNAGGGELRGLSQWAQLYTGAQINFWRSTSIFNLWFFPSGRLAINRNKIASHPERRFHSYFTHCIWPIAKEINLYVKLTINISLCFLNCNRCLWSIETPKGPVSREDYFFKSLKMFSTFCVCSDSLQNFWPAYCYGIWKRNDVLSMKIFHVKGFLELVIP